MSDPVTVSSKSLKQLIKALSGNLPEARVGILGSSTRKQEAEVSHESITRMKGQKQAPKPVSNATIGAAHEFGSAKLPKRSFLREPITDHLQERLDIAGAFDETKLKKVIADGSILEWMKKIAVTAEGIVLEGFDTGGFGKWKPSEMKFKKVKQTLVETTQLRNSITSEVK